MRERRDELAVTYGPDKKIYKIFISFFNFNKVINY